MGAMTLRMVPYLIRHPLFQHESSAVFQLCRHFPFDAVDDVAFVAPVVRHISRRIINPTHADIAVPENLPGCETVRAGMIFRWNGAPIGSSEAYGIVDVHGLRNY